jgi:putative pyruvate formate lyase activating enzyme
LASEEARVIIRVLVLPGHVNCCHKPALELLSAYRDKFWVSILDQYVPEYQACLDSDLKKRPTRTEIEEVKALVGKHGLKDIYGDGNDFWDPTK